MSEIVRTRFAPSPTGYLHIGGARTALFNYLLTKGLGGKFVLRIEDTDQTRNIPGAEQKLLEDLRWLGLHWDEGPEIGGEFGPYYQSQRLESYKQHARKLLDDGQAYYAFETPEELEARRKEAIQCGERGFRYPRPKRFASEAEAEKARREGRPVAVRFKMPERDFVVKDQILGEVEVAATELSDFVIIKADGWPTYHFAVVIDDEAMKITHVLRGQEHLLNTANHVALQEVFGFPVPVYAHLPIILNMDGSKMSKREKAVAVRTALGRGRVQYPAGTPEAEEFARRVNEAVGGAGVVKALADGEPLSDDTLRKFAEVLAVDLPEIDIHDFRVSGYLPEVLVNFIALLGWSAGDDREKYTLPELCQAFSLERVGKTSAKFDREKLLSFNTMTLAAADPERLLVGLKDWLGVNPGSPLAGLDDATLTRLIELCAGFRTFGDIERKCGAMFVADEDLEYDLAACEKVLFKSERAGVAVLEEMRGRLARLATWDAPAIEGLVRDFAAQRSLGLGKVAQPIRVAVTGSTVSPSIFETLETLGREKTLGRIDRLLVRLATPTS